MAPGKAGSAGVAPGKAGASDVDNTLHWKLSQAEKAKRSNMAPGGPRKTGTGDHSASSSASSMAPRSSSRIEVDGDDMTGYDDEGSARRREEEDHEALEQLNWELASNDGRITGMLLHALGQLHLGKLQPRTTTTRTTTS